ncbi:MAG: MBL fold metallo-hydrolase [Anaerolineae bacterium]|nr:MBL fold metallo-hydrolase [Gemmatimonadaceae bacterium]
MSLSVRFWGTRGSVPAPGAHTLRYGGNTPCVEVRAEGEASIILDAGTGIRELGDVLNSRANGEPLSVDIFLTHTHWDHIQGLPFFSPLYKQGSCIRIWGPDSVEAPLGNVFRLLMSPAVFPVSSEEVRAKVDIGPATGAPRRTAGCDIATLAVQHPGGAVAYRVSSTREPGSSLVYVPDNELAGKDARERDRLVQFARGAGLLVHDSTYTSEEYSGRQGWGHSTFEDAVELALAAGAAHLVLFHHAPERTDVEIDALVEKARAIEKGRGSGLVITAAAEGETLVVGGD